MDERTDMTPVADGVPVEEPTEVEELMEIEEEELEMEGAPDRLPPILSGLLRELQILSSQPSGLERFVRQQLDLGEGESYTSVTRQLLPIPVAATLSVRLASILESAGWEIQPPTSASDPNSPADYQQVTVGQGKTDSGLLNGAVACIRGDERAVLHLNLPLAVDLPDRSRFVVCYVPSTPDATQRANAILDEILAIARQQMPYRGQLLGFAHGTPEFLEEQAVTDEDFIVEDEVFRQLRRHLIDPATHHETLEKLGISPWRGAILEGPPGCGKTMAGRWVWGKLKPLGFTMIVVSPITFAYGMQTSVQTLFAMARELEPCLVWLEDLDLLAKDRSMANEGMLGGLLQALDGVESRGRVLVVATTNVPEVLDDAIAKRPGRFDAHIPIELPNAECRRRMLERFSRTLREQGILEEIPADLIEQTAGMSGAYLRELIHEAAIAAVAEAREGTPIRVTPAHLYGALYRLKDRGTQAMGFKPAAGKPADEV